MVAGICLVLLALKWLLPLTRSVATQLSELREAAVDVKVGSPCHQYTCLDKYTHPRSMSPAF